MKVYQRGFFLVIKFTSTHAHTYKTQTDNRTLKYNITVKGLTIV